MKKFLPILLLLMMLSACFHRPTARHRASAVLTEQQLDSIAFARTHHYTINDNFKVLADSIKLVPREDEQNDTTYVFRNEMLAIVKVKRNFVSAEDSLELSQADVNLMKSMEEANQQVDLSSPPPSDIVAAQAKDSTLSIPADTVWVKVATEHKTMGWITESTLLKHTVPNDSISELLRSLTNTRLLWMGGLLLLGILGQQPVSCAQVLFFRRNGFLHRLCRR